MEKRTLAFEIGTEEIPAFDLAGAVKQLSTMVPSLLDDAAIPHGAVKIFSSPRRLIVIAEEIPEATEEKNETPFPDAYYRKISFRSSQIERGITRIVDSNYETNYPKHMSVRYVRDAVD